ncbi:hypothetical protein AB0M32_09740 [Streptomyces sp. NPDC051985]|uniref:hypothetical protein n=1 Tax=Streptomyces sp. NPDC051985 TaxID=3155807 RepID=UPI00344A48DE
MAIVGSAVWQMTADSRTSKERFRLEEQIRSGQRDLERAAVFDAGVQPVAQWLGGLILASDDREPQREQILKRLVETAGQLICPDALCAYYELSPSQTELVRLVPDEDGGNLPRAYSDADDNGAYMVLLAKSQSGKPKYVPDGGQAYLEGGDRIRLTTGYKTALFLPVRVKSEPLGLMVIQTPTAGDIPAPQASEMLDGNYRKLYAITSLLGASRIAYRTPVRINGQRNTPPPTGEPTIVPGPE